MFNETTDKLRIAGIAAIIFVIVIMVLQNT